MSNSSGRKIGIVIALGVIAAVVAFAVIRSKSKSAGGAGAPPDVGVTQVEQKDVPIYRDWIGTLAGYVNADVKGQVTGYLLRQDYKEGAYVQKNQLLFEIDPRPFQAALDQALGTAGRSKGAARERNSNSRQDAARRGALYAVGEGASGEPAGPGQCGSEQSGGKSDGSDCERTNCDGPGRRRNRAAEPWIYPAHRAD